MSNVYNKEKTCLFAGIDAGSRAVKIVLFDARARKIVAQDLADQGIAAGDATEQLLDRLLVGQSLTRDDLAGTVATGYGRHTLRYADSTATEITCHALGVTYHIPDARTIIEIGGQDSKLLYLGPAGEVQDFLMNDRCAAGSGRFLETVAQRVAVPVTELGCIARRSASPAIINSTCVVFAETEMIGLLVAGTPPEDLLAGVQQAIARRVATMTKGVLHPPIAFTGGVALIPGMVEALAAEIGQPIAVAPDPQFTGALGASLLASRRAKNGD